MADSAAAQRRKNPAAARQTAPQCGLERKRKITVNVKAGGRNSSRPDIFMQFHIMILFFSPLEVIVLTSQYSLLLWFLCWLGLNKTHY